MNISLKKIVDKHRQKEEICEKLCISFKESLENGLTHGAQYNIMLWCGNDGK